MKESEKVKPQRPYRVYPSRKRKPSLLVTSPSLQGGDDNGWATYNIDLPPCDSEANVTGVSQTLIDDCLTLPLQCVYLKDYDGEARNTAMQTFRGADEGSTQKSKVVIETESRVRCSVSHKPKGCKRTSTKRLKLQSPSSKSNAERKALNSSEKSNAQEDFSCVQQKRVRPHTREEDFGSEKFRRPQHQIVGFLEDHAEFGSDWKEAVEGKGRYAPSVLESTVDGSIVKGARRSYGPRISPGDLDLFINAAIQDGLGDQDPLISLDEWRLKTEQHKYKCSQCEMVSRSRTDVDQHIAMSGVTHSEAVVTVLLGNQARGRSCPVCNMRLQRTHFFKHIRDSHSALFPLRCGYCVFLGKDHNQLRHHIRKKHGTKKYHIINIARLAADQPDEKSSLKDEEAGSDEEDEPVDDISRVGSLLCPLCGKALKTLSSLKKHVIQHGRQKQQCVLCPFTTSFPTQIRSHYRRKHPSETPQWQTVLLEKGGNDSLVEDVAPYLKLVTTKYGVRQPKKEGKWMRQYRCPHCDYTCNFNSSYSRHLRLHDGVKPYKCGYCDFHAREAYVIRKHCAKVHKGKKTIIENDKDFRAPYRYEAQMKKKKCEWMECSERDEEEFSSTAVRNILPPLGSRVKEVGESSAPQVKEDTVRIHRDNDSSSGNIKESVSLGVDISVSNNKRGAASLCENKKIDRPKRISSKINHPKKTVKLDHRSALAPLKVRMTAEGPEAQMKHTQVLDMTENCSLQPVGEVLETCTTEQVKVISGKTGETVSLTSLMKTFCSGREGDYQLESDESQISTPRYLLQGSVPVKVKTFKRNDESLGKGTKRDSGVDRTDTCVRQLETKNDEPVMSERDLVTSAHIENEGTCCSTINVPNIGDMSENTVVIHLSAGDGETLELEKITHCTSSVEIKRNPAVIEQTYSEINNSDPCTPDLRNTSYPLIDVMERSTDKVTEPVKKGNTSKGNAAHVKEIKLCENQADHKLEPLICVPTEGLENNLHTHIAFLTDSRVQRLSNRISATPGVMTRDLLGLDYSNNDYFCSEKVRLMMRKKEGGRVKCIQCGTTTTYRAFYKHAKKHFNVKPFKCGYCSYRSIEKSKIRVHNTFCHPSSPCIILKLSPETAGVNAANPTHENESPLNAEDDDNNSQASLSEYAVSGADRNSLSSTADISIQKSGKARKPISQEKSLTAPPSVVPSLMVNSPQRQPPFQCPICFKRLQKHTPSIRRHLYSHYGYKPYKCGYCTFIGIGQSEVRAHHVTHGFTAPPKVEPSGMPMPHGLIPYVNDLLTHHRRPPHKRKGQTCQQNLTSQLRQVSGGEPDLLWTEAEMVSKEDLTAIYLTPQDDSNQVSCSQVGDLNAVDVEPCPLAQPLEAEDLSSEAAYAVQGLESGQNTISPGTLPSQLDLGVGTESHSNCSSDSVCVVYFIE